MRVRPRPSVTRPIDGATERRFCPISAEIGTLPNDWALRYLALHLLLFRLPARKILKINHFLLALDAHTVWHGGCLTQGMMSTLNEAVETPKRVSVAHCTREKAAQLLESLRAAYQSLPLAERTLAKSMISQMARLQFTRELSKENECFELPF